MMPFTDTHSRQAEIAALKNRLIDFTRFGGRGASSPRRKPTAPLLVNNSPQQPGKLFLCSLPILLSDLLYHMYILHILSIHDAALT